MFHENPDQIALLSSNLVANIARKHDERPSIDRSVDVARDLEEHILAALERASGASD